MKKLSTINNPRQYRILAKTGTDQYGTQYVNALCLDCQKIKHRKRADILTGLPCPDCLAVK